MAKLLAGCLAAMSVVLVALQLNSVNSCSTDSHDKTYNNYKRRILSDEKVGPWGPCAHADGVHNATVFANGYAALHVVVMKLELVSEPLRSPILSSYSATLFAARVHVLDFSIKAVASRFSRFI